MTCYHPNPAYYNGEKMIVIPKGGLVPPGYHGTRVPCLGCIGCRTDKAQQWATRSIHEAQMHKENCFITLTYDDEHLPPWPWSLDKEHHKTFIKNLRYHLSRKQINPKTGRLKRVYKKIKYYHCGEYGTATPLNNFIARPHFHTLLFGHEFKDLKIWKREEGITTYTSETLDGIWEKGQCIIGELNHQSAGYVARYCLKKITGDLAQEHYEKTDIYSGEIQNIQPEYSTMSRRPGIGASWYEKYKSDIFPSDQTILKGGKQVKTPRYYDLLLKDQDETTYLQIKEERTTQAEKAANNSTRKRLKTREIVKQAQLTSLHRNKI